MYVRKFEADSLEEALQEIKKELGPDAIILKTVTNKGLKGAFKKKKIEITAAISEKNYGNKNVVDKAVGDMKDKFYANPASYISNMIDNHVQHNNQNKKPANKSSGYGNLALNRPVNQVQKDSSENVGISIGLDDFLKGPASAPEMPKTQKFSQPVVKEEIDDLDEFVSAPETVQTKNQQTQSTLSVPSSKVEELERKLYELSKRVEKLDRKEPDGIYHLRTTLRSLDISEKYVQTIVKKAIFDLTEEELQKSDSVFEFALKEMLKVISVDQPLFAKSSNNKPVVTVLLSEISSGQTSVMLKLGSIKKGSILLKNFSSPDEKSLSFTEKMFDMEIEKVNTISELVSKTRVSTEKDTSVFIDYRVGSQKDVDETKKFIEGLKRSFTNVEVLITLSAIHSEMYNKKVVATYKSLANGLIVSHLDMCLNYGALFNLCEENRELPIKFFGTGKIVPDDIEAATPERVLAGIFQFE